MTAAAPPAFAASGPLPGGTSIEVDVTSPTDGALIASPPGLVPLGGTAAVGEGVPVADTTLIYVIDVSGSTHDGGGCGGDRNADGASNRVLDCEIAAAEALNQQAIDAGTVDEVGLVSLHGAASIRDVNPAAGGLQQLTSPAADADGSGGRDVEQAMRTLLPGGNTNFEAAVQQACGLAPHAEPEAGDGGDRLAHQDQGRRPGDRDRRLRQHLGAGGVQGAASAEVSR